MEPHQFHIGVDNFGIKYSGEEHVYHLIQVLKQDYQIEEDWGGTQYIGLIVDWDYKRWEVHISMPGYIEKALAWLGHQVPKDPQHQPHTHKIPSYGVTIQYAKAEDTSRPLTKDEKKYIQQVIGPFLYYGQVVDPTMLTSRSSIVSMQAKPTKESMIKMHSFLDYAATHQVAIITYHTSNMELVIHSDASYLSKPKARSQAGGHFFMSSNTNDPDNNSTLWSSPSSSNLWCLQQQKPSLVQSMLTHARQSRNANSWKKWDTHNHQLWCKLITAPPLV
jgi:hypothetical protein